MLVHCQALLARAVESIGAQQLLGVARVLAGQRVDPLQQVQRAQADVGQVANRSGHHVQCAGRVLLRPGRFLRGLQGMGEGSGQGRRRQ